MEHVNIVHCVLIFHLFIWSDFFEIIADLKTIMELYVPLVM